MTDPRHQWATQSLRLVRSFLHWSCIDNATPSANCHAVPDRNEMMWSANANRIRCRSQRGWCWYCFDGCLDGCLDGCRPQRRCGEGGRTSPHRLMSRRRRTIARAGKCSPSQSPASLCLPRSLLCCCCSTATSRAEDCYRPARKATGAARVPYCCSLHLLQPDGCGGGGSGRAWTDWEGRPHRRLRRRRHSDTRRWRGGGAGAATTTTGPTWWGGKRRRWCC